MPRTPASRTKKPVAKPENPTPPEALVAGHRPSSREIRLLGVRQNNLKNFDLHLPLGQWIVITGLSGSGKSSLAFETLYAEGQRRYIETFTPYARQFFDRMDKPAVDRIENIPPAIAIEQRNAVRTTRSTVGTMTEVCDYLKMVWPHLSELYCRNCSQPVRRESPQSIWESLTGTCGNDSPEVLITFELPLSEKLGLDEQIALLTQQGFQRLLVGNSIVRMGEATPLLSPVPNQLVVIADRVRLTAANRARLIEACEQSYSFGRGRLSVHRLDGSVIGPGQRFSVGFHCARCQLDYREPTPALFSFNHPQGACPDCRGFGRIVAIDPSLAIPDPGKTLADGAVRPWQTGMSADCQSDMVRMAKRHGVPLHIPFRHLSPEHQRWVMEGEPGHGEDGREWPHSWYGVKGYFKWLESNAYKMHVRVLLSRYRSYRLCPACKGQRFNPDSLLFRLPLDSEGPSARAGGPLTLADFYQLPIRDSLALVRRLAARHTARTDPLGVVLGEVETRLGYLEEVGLGYLTLDRPTRTLSGGETERVNLTTCLGTRLVQALFVLDEPSVGLHPRDTGRLIHILRRLRDAGNTVVVVEHEASIILAADQIVDLGPGHGETGGHLVFQGPPSGLVSASGSLTADYLTHRRRIPAPPRRPTQRMTDGGQTPSDWLSIQHARVHNLQDLTVDIPLGRLVALTGVSGSGKTTLLRDVLLPLLNARFASGPSDDHPDGEPEDSAEDESQPNSPPVGEAILSGGQSLSRVILVDQTPLGRTPRSNPAVYVGAFEDIRDVFASSAEAQARGMESSAFSFNSKSGQCERCRGAGFEKIEMQFLSDIYIKCPVCGGRRYREHILDVKIPGQGHGSSTALWSIADILDATIEDAVRFLGAHSSSKAARRAIDKLRLLEEVGLGYLRVGQPINTLSGGESQRLKLVSHLTGPDSSAFAQSIPTVAAAQAAVRRLQKKTGTTSPPSGGKSTLFLFDEPTTGLHFDDVRVLLAVFQRLTDAGHSVVVIEHNLDVIHAADWVVDLGPDAGDLGGRVVVAGPPEIVARCAESHTGRYLRDHAVPQIV
jgi:excinuclease ABC subunit A